MNTCRVLFKFLFLFLSLAMIGVTAYTSRQSNLITEWNRLGAEPWMRATLIDFYFNILIISTWAAYKEKNKLIAALWIAAFVLLGSIATAFYVFLQIARLKPGEPLQKILLRSE